MTELETEANTIVRKLRPKPFTVIVVTLAAVLVGFQLVGPLIGFFLYLPFYSGNLMSMANDLQNLTAHPELKMLMFIMQGGGACLGLILIPYFIRKWSQTDEKILGQPVYLFPISLVFIIVFAFMGVNSILIEWNQEFKFPSALAELEKTLRSMEDQLAEASKYLTTFDSFTQFATAFFVIAVLASIGEELVFRGVIQKELFRGTNNIHVSIWAGAIIFSAFHMQFFGFVPRMFLGAMFGYLYYWSGNLMLSMLAHFVNNGFIVVALYLHQQKIIDMDIESTESAPWQAVLFSAIFTIVLLYTFRKFYQQKNLTTPA